MSRCAKHHLELDAHGIGKCSVPMFDSGGDAGFCDRPAYNTPPIRGSGYSGYVPGLACTRHGGEGPRFDRDGNAWCATTAAFVNLQESIAGFGDTKEAAEVDLLRQHSEALP